MPLFDDLINYNLCFPAAVTGSTELECPPCGELLTVSVNDPMGKNTLQCGEFDVDWCEGTGTPCLQLDLTVDTKPEVSNEALTFITSHSTFPAAEH